jgi:hydroxyacylglutathione hydrolase
MRSSDGQEKMRMHIVTTLGTLANNYTFVIESDGQAVVIDPGESSPVLRALERSGSRLLAVLCTHAHFDHTGGSEELKLRTGCEIRLPDGSPGDAQLKFGPMTFTMLRTPGHSADSVCLYLPPTPAQSGDVFTGDTLFVGGCGRIFGHPPAVMWASLQRLAALPDDTRVFSGHDYALENYEFALTLEPENAAVKARLEEIRALVEAGQPTVPSTIAAERATNPFLRAGDPSLKRAVSMENASDTEVFAEVRRRKDRF